MKLQSVLDEMSRLSAWSALVTSGKRIELQLESGTTHSQDPVSHEAITQMLLEVAPPSAQADIRVGKPPSSFIYHYKGSSYSIQADAFRERWSVAIASRESEDDPNVIDFGAVTIEAPIPAGENGGNGGAAGPPRWDVLPGTAKVDFQLGAPEAARAPVPSARPPEPGSARPVDAISGRGMESPAQRPRGSGPGDLIADAAARVMEGLRPSRSADSAPPPPWATEPPARPVRAPEVPAEPVRSTEGIRGRPAESVVDAVVRGGDPQTRSGEAPRPPVAPPVAGAKPAASGTAAAKPADAPWDTAPPVVETAHAGEPRSEPRINTILRKLIDEDGSDVHFTTGLVPRFRIDGNILPMPGFGVMTEENLRSMLFEIMPERIRRQFEDIHDTDFAHSIEGLSRFRVNVAMDRHGVFSVIRVIPNRIMSPEQIGLPKRVLDLCWLTKGLVLVTGPTGSGKSTTLATIIDYINSNRQDHIITIEDPIEFVHPDTKKCLIRQRQVGEHTTSFKKALRAALREDPDIVLVGELRDLETIEIAIETAETGHLVFGTLHTSTAASTVDRVIDQFPAERQDQIRVMLSESLKGVIAQTLCKKINGGRTAAYEVLLCTKAISNLIREGKTFQIHSILQTSKSAGMCTMADSLFHHVRSRAISPEEAWMKCVDKEELRAMFEKANIRLKMASLEDL